MIEPHVKHNEFRDEQRGGVTSRIVYCHVYEDNHVRRRIELDEDVLKIAYQDTDGDGCEFVVPVSVVQELMRRAGMVDAAVKELEELCLEREQEREKLQAQLDTFIPPFKPKKFA